MQSLITTYITKFPQPRCGHWQWNPLPSPPIWSTKNIMNGAASLIFFLILHCTRLGRIIDCHGNHEYDGILETRLPLTSQGDELIWRPELVLNESVSTDFASFIPETTAVVVKHTGKIYWYTLANMQSFCSVSVRNYPFDKQTCHLTFTTWLYQTTQEETHTSEIGLTCVLTLFVSLTFVFTKLPSTGQPIIGSYIIWLIIEAVMVTVYGLINALNLRKKRPRMPWLRKTKYSIVGVKIVSSIIYAIIFAVVFSK
ncbi:putative neuronal acetylcholine receptor subunit alpha-9 isoform X5 [Apostichopus japonicus]|uniref:Putative neuronal acetylcholine receptor subunit alpha-9 isoform X5 n=1 Tax=Stichopus japonicus TaxID=307972 RepID=A0A2G8LR71_STIJA|nr:putative neuronal acetylcholine receptor subunit alpha-9 isoform X5 [Apostichopus japonicus]